MKKIVTLLFLLVSFVTYSQGVGYLNYTVYNIYTASPQIPYANNATDFVNMFDITKGTTVHASGITTAAIALNFVNSWTPSGVPYGGAYTGIKITGYFVAKETGTYSFGIDGDDGVDFLLDGVVVTSFYGPHGFGGYHYGTISLVAGKSYTFMARYQNWGGGWGLRLLWKRPSQSSWSIQSDEVTTITSTPTKKAMVNFNFNTNLTATTFLIGSSAFNSSGLVDITTSLDSAKISSGDKGTIVGGGVEWSYVDLGATSTLHIDMRKFGNTTPSSVSQIKLLDVYEGPVTYISNDGTWANYSVPSSLTKVTDGTSTNSQYIRNGNGYYAFACEVTFASVMAYKQQSITLTTTNTMSTLYNSIVTVTDVYLAFKELANGGIFGNQSGNEFTHGIQYKNSDVNDDGTFNEKDCFALLQHLTGAKTLVDTFNLNKTLRIIAQTRYDSIGKSNWNTFSTPLGSSNSFDINTGKSIDSLNFTMAWKGDVNLSHSSTPKTNNLTSMSVRGTSVSNEINASILTEVVGDSVYAYITLDPLAQSVVGAQFQLNYDNSVLTFKGIKFTTKGAPTNFATDKGAYVNLGSLISDGSTSLDNTTTYKVSFSSKSKLNNMLGLVSIGTTDAVNKSGQSLKIRMN
jgi:hypothetical protein